MTNTSTPNILIVDDTENNIDFLIEILADEYNISVAMDGESALRFAMQQRPDLVLLDIMMPGIDGYEVCRRLKAIEMTKHIPVLFISAMSDEDDEARGLELGAMDYITKPVKPAVVLARIRNILELHNYSLHLEELVEQRTTELEEAQDATIESMAVLAEFRDKETGGHIKRTRNFVRRLAEELAEHPKFKDELDNETINWLYKSAPLHDIGKVGIPDAILHKPGKLTSEEFDVMKQHAEFGYQAIQSAEDKLGCDLPFLKYAKEIAHTHHEKWDGSGYPQGLTGQNIPLSGRLMAIADVYDALISKRVYKPAFTHQDAVNIIVEGRGKHFDPDMVDTFLEIDLDFYQIALAFADDDFPEPNESEMS